MRAHLYASRTFKRATRLDTRGIVGSGIDCDGGGGGGGDGNDDKQNGGR